MKVELKGIEIVMGNNAVKLSITEAQELRKQLNELFGEKITYIPSTPIIIERDRWPYWDYPYTPRWTYTGTPITTSTPVVYCCSNSEPRD
jgi:hypothetical protein